jgi:hypothetical protein
MIKSRISRLICALCFQAPPINYNISYTLHDSRAHRSLVCFALLRVDGSRRSEVDHENTADKNPTKCGKSSKTIHNQMKAHQQPSVKQEILNRSFLSMTLSAEPRGEGN